MSKADLQTLVEFAADLAFNKIIGRKKPMTAFCLIAGAAGEHTMIELLFRPV